MVDIQRYKPEWVNIKDINYFEKKFQFRQNIETSHLAQSIREEGQKFPIVLWKRMDGSIQIISGFRRFSVAKQFNWDKILGIIIPEEELNEEEALKLNFIENIERKSLTDMDLIYSAKKLKDQGKSNVEIGKLIGKDEAIVRRYLRVANSPAEIQEAVKEGRISIKKLNSLFSTLGLGRKEEGDKKISMESRTGSELKAAFSTPSTYELSIEGEIATALKSDNYKENIQNLINQYRGIVSEISKLPAFPRKMTEITNKEEIIDYKPIATYADLIPTDRMHVKPVKGGGFDLILKFRPQTDDVQKAIQFLNKNIENLKLLINGNNGRNDN